MAKREMVWIANLYLRLSKEDKRSANAESISIETQRMKTSSFANRNNIIIRKEYVDDGESGVFFERPEFQASFHACCDFCNSLFHLFFSFDNVNSLFAILFIAFVNFDFNSEFSHKLRVLLLLFQQSKCQYSLSWTHYLRLHFNSNS